MTENKLTSFGLDTGAHLSAQGLRSPGEAAIAEMALVPVHSLGAREAGAGLCLRQPRCVQTVDVPPAKELCLWESERCWVLREVG